MKLSYEQLKATISQYVDANKIATSDLQVTRNNVVGLADKIGATFTLDTSYTDKLAFMDGGDLDWGKTVEEWSLDLTLAEDHDPTGANNMSPHYPTHRPVYYSKSLGRKYVPTTIPFGNIERAVNNADQFSLVTSTIMKRLYDSEAVYKYGVKRQVLADLANKCESAMNSIVEFNVGTNYAVDTYVIDDGASTNKKAGIIVKPYVGGAVNFWSEAVEQGYIIELDLVTTIDKPIDTATGEAFVKQVKNDVEIASDQNEGHSLSGNSLGATDGLVLIVKQGLLPTLEVDVQAGAFNGEKVAIPSEIVVVKDFGNADASVFAILMDRRGARLFNDYNAVREDANGKGDFINYYKHFEYTAHTSRNTFVKVYKSA